MLRTLLILIVLGAAIISIPGCGVGYYGGYYDYPDNYYTPYWGYYDYYYPYYYYPSFGYTYERHEFRGGERHEGGEHHERERH